MERAFMERRIEFEKRNKKRDNKAYQNLVQGIKSVSGVESVDFPPSESMEIVVRGDYFDTIGVYSLFGKNDFSITKIGSQRFK